MGRSSTSPKWVLPFMLLLGHLAAQISAEDGTATKWRFEVTPSGGFSSDAIVDGPTGIPSWKSNGNVELVESGQKQGGMILIVPQGRHAVRLGNDAETIDLQTLYNVQGWDPYAWAFEAEEDDVKLVFRNPGMEDDPTCGPIIDDVAIKKLFTPDRPKNNAVVNGDFEEGPWMLANISLGVLIPTNLDEEETSSLPGWIVESNRAVRYIDSYHFAVATGQAERTRIAFYSVYYNTRTDDMSSLCGPVVDDVRVWFSGTRRNGLGGLGLRVGLALCVLVLVLV
ncbi:hypothetical protein M0R45_013586 [Rubus argutus]|uniref:DUF642 domain-containing protein n=1 Tax=Rubus argutus TaxID=59490 RepID=A0AAW1XK31_RUBAR